MSECVLLPGYSSQPRLGHDCVGTDDTRQLARRRVQRSARPSAGHKSEENPDKRGNLHTDTCHSGRSEGSENMTLVSPSGKDVVDCDEMSKQNCSQEAQIKCRPVSSTSDVIIPSVLRVSEVKPRNVEPNKNSKRDTHDLSKSDSNSSVKSSAKTTVLAEEAGDTAPAETSVHAWSVPPEGPDLDQETDTTSSLSGQTDTLTPAPAPPSLSDSEEYDTDLDIDDEFAKKPTDWSDFHIGKDVYARACKRWRTSPQSRLMKSLPERTLTLRNRSLGPAAIPPLSLALRENLRVEQLNLDGTDIGEKGCQSIAEMLLDNLTIQYVNLANNSLGMRGAQLMGHVITVTQHITHLDLSGNKMTDKAAWFLSTALGANTSLARLNLGYNDFEERSGALLGGALARNNKLKCLVLCWNKIRGKGAVAIFQALMFNSTLESLDLSWNGVGYEGAVALSSMLKRNRGLKDLDVSNNRIDWRGAGLITEGLRENKTLNKLKIGFNPLSTTGCMDLLRAAATTTSGLSLLDASEVSVLGEADLLAATINRRRRFQFRHGGIVASHDKLGERTEREIKPMMRVIEYLRLLGLRPLDLMRSFDKTVSFELPRKDFMEQIKKIGVKLHSFEIEALANTISAKGLNRDVINYRKLSMAVREVVLAERERKMREQEKWKQIKLYHTQILHTGAPEPIPPSTTVFGTQGDRDLTQIGLVPTPGDSHGSVKSQTTGALSSVQRAGYHRGDRMSCTPMSSMASSVQRPRQLKLRRSQKTKKSR